MKTFSMTSHAKKSFEYRMSKKVAELTQVVHMLFTRNHEKEVELEAYKGAYEHEIQLVQEDARSRIAKLEKEILELKKILSEQGSKKTQNVEENYKKIEDQYKQTVTDLESRLTSEQRECQSLRDLLLRAHKDLESLRQARDEEISKWNFNNDVKGQEISKLKTHVTTLEKKLRDLDVQSNGVIMELQRSHNRLQKENNQMKTTNQEHERAKEQLNLCNKKLDAEIRQLKKELGKRERRNSAASSIEVKEVRDANVVDYVEEIERLRRELQKYRNELLNREGNFNRMFVEHAPVLVDRKAGRMAASTDSPVTFRNNRDMSSTYTPSRASVGNDDDLSSVVTLSRIGSGRLPQLSSSDPRASLKASQAAVKLAKPKPPRELLSTKVAGRA